MAASPQIREIEFERDKYGPELLVDVGWVSDLEGFVLDTQPHRLNFYDLLLVTEGRGELAIDDRLEPIEPDRLVFTSPGQVRRLDASGLEGIVLFFVGEFVEDFFNDPLFLHRLRFFFQPRGPLSLPLARERSAWLVQRLEGMRRELERLQPDSIHLMRAVLYEVLVTLNRWYAEARGAEPDRLASPLVARFLKLLEQHLPGDHRVASYAARLGITPGHLSDLVREQLGLSAGSLIRGRLLQEAKRRLLYSTVPAYEIAHRLGFDDPSYFSRFFKRETGLAPRDFRVAAARGR